jgi:AcrR family transcriptional regulator
MPSYNRNSATKAGGATARFRLIAAACDEFCEIPFHDTDAVKITERANLSPGTFYNYFKDEIEIFIESFEYINQIEVDDVKKKIEQASIRDDDVDKIIEEIFSSLLNSRRRHALMRLQCAILRRTDSRIIEAERRAQSQYVINITRALTRSADVDWNQGDQDLNIYILSSLINAIANEDFDERHLARVIREVKSIISMYFDAA